MARTYIEDLEFFYPNTYAILINRFTDQPIINFSIRRDEDDITYKPDTIIIMDFVLPFLDTYDGGSHKITRFNNPSEWLPDNKWVKYKELIELKFASLEV
jgi:hypothetical protein